MDRIVMEHGSGGRATGELIGEIFEKAFSNEVLHEMEDAAGVTEASGSPSQPTALWSRLWNFRAATSGGFVSAEQSTIC